ncbi:hypothetical protein Nps_00690 [Candidatus Nanopusillus acidilobi]|nr:hypothetical protein Nps_00690 [Candidatus Nanopusillus acidilobi]
MSLDSKSLSEIVSLHSLDLSELKFKSKGPLGERSFQKRLDKLLESYGSYGILAYILLGNLQIRRTINYNGGYVLYSPVEKIISKEIIKIIFGDSPRYKEIEDSIDIYTKNGELYLPQRLKDHTIGEAEIDALVIARGYDGKLFLYNIELKGGLMKNENDERYKKAHLQLFRSTDILINALLETEIISKDSEFYTFSILYSRYWYRTVYLFVYKNRNLYAYYVNNEDKSIEYQIPLNGLEMKKYADYNKDEFEYSMEKRGIILYLLGLGNHKNYKKYR